MKNSTLFIKRSLILFLALWIPQLINGATFVATTSGNFSSSATWAGGIVPPLMNTLDEIVISPGVTVNLDQNLTLNGALAVLDVQGTLTASNNSTLTIDAGTVSGSGVMMLEDIILNAGTLFVFDGALTSDMIHVATTIVTTATLTVTEMLQLMGGTIEIASGGSLDLAGEATIIISNGVLSEGIGGFIDLTDEYDVVYLNNSAVAGIELTGPGLQDLTIEVSAGQTVTATSDIVVDGTLSMASGILVLSDKDLTVNGAIDGSGSGTVSSTAVSDIFLNTTDSVAGTLDFAAGAAVNNLNVNAGASNTVGITGDVIVEGALQLTSGVMSIADASLTVNGDVTGSGMLSANAATDLAITHTGALSSALTFAAGGQVVQDISLSVGDNAVSLGSDLSVQGALDLAVGSDLDLNGQSLTLGATSAITGSGSLLVDAASDLTIESTGGISSLLMAGTVGNLTVNTTTGTVSLGGDASVSGMFNLSSGTLSLNGHDLTLSGNIAAGGTGAISSTAVSDIILNTNGSVTGTLDFAAGAAVNNLNVNAGASNTVGITGDVIVEGALQLTSGVMSIADATLTVNGDVTGSGMLSANAATDLAITHTGALSSALTFAAGGQVVQDLSLSVGDNAVSLGSDLSVQGALDLTGGSDLDLNGQSLTLGATSSLTGSGSLLVDAAADLTIESTEGISSLPMVGTVGNLTVNTAGGTVSLGGDASVSGMLNLSSGTLSLNGHDLTLSGNIAAGGTGTISSSSSSNISVTAGASPSGSLSFSSGANSVGNLGINIGNDGELVLGSDLQVMGGVQFMAGQLDLDGHTLDITGSASFSGAGINSYVITEGGGTVEMDLTSGASASFPVGTASFYAPAEISLAQGSASGNVQVRVENNVMSEGTSGVDLSAYESVVDATWHVSSDITTNLDMNMNLAWQSGMEVNAFDHTQAYISHYTSGEWDSYAEGSAVAEGNGMFSISRSGITNLSPFAVFDRTTVTGTGDVQDVSFKLYPNPSIEEIIIESKASETEQLEVVIYNSAGQSVKKETLTSGISTISIRELTEGNYFIQFSGHNGSGTKQFTKI